MSLYSQLQFASKRHRALSICRLRLKLGENVISQRLIYPQSVLPRQNQKMATGGVEVRPNTLEGHRMEGYCKGGREITQTGREIATESSLMDGWS